MEYIENILADRGINFHHVTPSVLNMGTGQYVETRLYPVNGEQTLHGLNITIQLDVLYVRNKAVAQDITIRSTHRGTERPTVDNLPYVLNMHI